MNIYNIYINKSVFLTLIFVTKLQRSMDFLYFSIEPPAYNQLNEPNDQLKSTDEDQHNQYPGSNQYPSPGGAQYPGNQYQPQAVPLVVLSVLLKFCIFSTYFDVTIERN